MEDKSIQNENEKFISSFSLNREIALLYKE